MSRSLLYILFTCRVKKLPHHALLCGVTAIMCSKKLMSPFLPSATRTHVCGISWPLTSSPSLCVVDADNRYQTYM